MRIEGRRKVQMRRDVQYCRLFELVPIANKFPSGANEAVRIGCTS